MHMNGEEKSLVHHSKRPSLKFLIFYDSLNSRHLSNVEGKLSYPRLPHIIQQCIGVPKEWSPES